MDDKCITVNENMEEKIINSARMNIDYYNYEIRSLENKIFKYKKLIEKQYEKIRDTCKHNLVREKEAIPYGEFYVVCSKCDLLKK